jgi:hypothetical protein
VSPNQQIFDRINEELTKRTQPAVTAHG